MDIIQMQDKLFALWTRHSESFSAAGVILLILFLIYQLMLYLEKRNSKAKAIHDGLDKMFSVVFNLVTRLVSVLIFLVSIFIVISVIVKLIILLWKL